MTIKSQLTLLLVAFGVSACAQLQSISITEIPQQRDRVVKAEVDNFAFLGLHFSNDFVDELREQLRAQCPKGRVTGILTKYQTYWYLLLERREVTARGFCVDDPGMPANLSTPTAQQGRPRGRT
jgi:hypothetical protein